MKFTYYFDLFDFDENKNVCASKKYTLPFARSNFLYMVAKYNQTLLQNQNLPLPAFFKENLKQLLQAVEAGEDFLKVKQAVVNACLPEVQLLANKADQEFLLALGEKAKLKDEAFAEKFKTAKNHLQLSYIITNISGKKFEQIFKLLQAEQDDKTKSAIFKGVIQYNALINVAEKVKDSGAVEWDDIFA